MSFTSEQKKYIIEQTYKSSCCRRAILQGALFAKGELLSECAVSVSVGARDIAEFLYKMILEFYGAPAEIRRAENGGRRVLLLFDSKSASNYIRNIGNKPLYSQKCDLCTSAFMRGVFLASGRAADPRKQYFLEFSLGDRCEIFAQLLSDIGTSPKILNKKNERIVYFKKSSDIEDFCGFAGLNKAMFSFIDAKVEGEFRKNAMRVANCETRNIARSVSAASRQLEVIRAMDRANLLSSLPEELEATARLRMEYADLSLSQLASIAVPAISKPGLSHRLNRIIEIGERLLMKTGK